MAVMIALGNDKDLGFIDFQLFPGLEWTDPGSLKHHDYVATILHQVSLQQAIASARIQLCAVAIKSFLHWHREYAILYCFTLGKPVDLQWMAKLFPWPGGISLTNLA